MVVKKTGFISLKERPPGSLLLSEVRQKVAYFKKILYDILVKLVLSKSINGQKVFCKGLVYKGNS